MFAALRRLAQSISTGAAVLMVATGLTGCFMYAMPYSFEGNRAPELTIDELYQAPRSASVEWPDLTDRVVVLQFWNPWIDASTKHIEHMNALHDAMQGRPVVFIHINEGTTADLTRYIKRIPIKGWLAVDSDSSAFSAYRIGTAPTTVVVDGDGIIRYYTKPELVTENTIRDVLGDFDGGPGYVPHPSVVYYPEVSPDGLH